MSVRHEGGGHPLFHSYHDVRIPPNLAGPTVPEERRFRFAFDDFVKAIEKEEEWRKRFAGWQVAAVEMALRMNNHRIAGFRWRYHQEQSIMQLVPETEHWYHELGGRFTGTGRHA